MKNNYTFIKEKIQELIYVGEIKSEEALKDIPIDKLNERFGLCPNDLICYFCYKKNNNKCIHSCS